MLITVGKTIGVDMTPTTPTKRIFRKIMNLVLTNRFLREGAREYYALMPCGDMLQRCHIITEGAEPTRIRAMPMMLVTPFKPAAA